MSAALGAEAPLEQGEAAAALRGQEAAISKNAQREESRAFWENQARAAAVGRGVRSLSLSHENGKSSVVVKESTATHAAAATQTPSVAGPRPPDIAKAEGHNGAGLPPQIRTATWRVIIFNCF